MPFCGFSQRHLITSTSSRLPFCLGQIIGFLMRSSLPPSIRTLQLIFHASTQRWWLSWRDYRARVHVEEFIHESKNWKERLRDLFYESCCFGNHRAFSERHYVKLIYQRWDFERLIRATFRSKSIVNFHYTTRTKILYFRGKKEILYGWLHAIMVVFIFPDKSTKLHFDGVIKSGDCRRLRLPVCVFIN